MDLSSNLKMLFPKYNMESSPDSVCVTEKNENAKVKCIKWIGSSTFHNIDTKTIIDLAGFFKKAGASDSFHKDCDGIIAFEEGENKYIFLSELKSTFDTSDLYKAKDQLISSYIKLNMIMHLLPENCKCNCKFMAFIACLPPNRDYLRDLDKETQLKSKSKYKTEAEFAADLCYKSSGITLKPTDCDKLKDLPLGDHCLFDELTFHYLEVPTGQDSKEVNIHNYIKT